MERLGWVGNFRAAAEGRLPEGRNGVVFTDSDVYKLMEAAAWEVGRSGSADAEMGHPPDSRIDSIRGCLAVEQGPLVLCVESVDLPDGASVDDIRIDPAVDLEMDPERVTARGRLIDFEDRAWPYPESDDKAASGREVEIPPHPVSRLGQPRAFYDAGVDPGHDWLSRHPRGER